MKLLVLGGSGKRGAHRFEQEARSDARRTISSRA